MRFVNGVHGVFRSNEIGIEERWLIDVNTECFHLRNVIAERAK